MKILMVCLGNICRSPLAQGILEHKVKANGLNWQVDSAGTGGGHVGMHPDDRSIKVAQKYGIDISMQEARRIHPEDFKRYDLIYCMDSRNYADVIEMCNTLEEEAKVKMIMNEVEAKKNISVADPYYGGADGFENTYQMLGRACDAIIRNYGDKKQ